MEPSGGRIAERLRLADAREAIPSFHYVADNELASRRIQPPKKRTNFLKASSKRSPEDGLLGAAAVRSSDLASSGNPLEAVIAIDGVSVSLMGRV